MSDEVKKLGAKEFREQGYLQELNRQFLHPLGLTLEVVKNADGSESFGMVWDNREDPEGFLFEENQIDPVLAARVHQEFVVKHHFRVARFGYTIQPDRIEEQQYLEKAVTESPEEAHDMEYHGRCILYGTEAADKWLKEVSDG